MFLLGSGVDLYCQVAAFVASLLATFYETRDEFFAEASSTACLSLDLYLRVELQEG